MQHGGEHLADQPGRRPGQRRVGAHAAGVRAAVSVVAAPGYPESPRTGSRITGADGDGVLHAGTAVAADGSVVSAGGRVLSVVG
ncbi:MAG: phosphoribosylglycinamide synthetase C domain-containing protein, partial [Blastococcus sp.]